MVPCCDKRFLAVGAGFRQVSFGADSSAEQIPGFKSPAQVWLVPRGVLAKIRRHGRMGPVWAVWAKVPMRFFGTIDGAHCCMVLTAACHVFLPPLLSGMPPGNLPGYGLHIFHKTSQLPLPLPSPRPPPVFRSPSRCRLAGPKPYAPCQIERCIKCTYFWDKMQRSTMRQYRNRCPTECQNKMPDRMSEKMWNKMSECQVQVKEHARYNVR